MNELPNDVSNTELRAELQALRKKLEDLEARQAAMKPRAHGALRRRFSTAFLVASVLLAVVFAGGGMLWGDQVIQAMFIDKNGNVGINQMSPTERLDVNGNMLINGTAGIKGASGTAALKMFNGTGQLQLQYKVEDGKNRIGFTDGQGKWMSWSEYSTNNAYIPGNLGIGTAPAAGIKLSVDGNATIGKAVIGDVGHDANWPGFASSGSVGVQGYALKQSIDGLTTAINKKSGAGSIGFRIDNVDKMVLDNNGNVGIGTSTPDANAKLDVKGEIRGKPWYSRTYSWQKDQDRQRLTRTDRSVCFFTRVKGKFNGKEEVGVEDGKDGYWYLSGWSAQPLEASVICIGAPDGSW